MLKRMMTPPMNKTEFLAVIEGFDALYTDHEEACVDKNFMRGSFEDGYKQVVSDAYFDLPSLEDVTSLLELVGERGQQKVIEGVLTNYAVYFTAKLYKIIHTRIDHDDEHGYASTLLDLINGLLPENFIDQKLIRLVEELIEWHVDNNKFVAKIA